MTAQSPIPNSEPLPAPIRAIAGLLTAATLATVAWGFFLAFAGERVFWGTVGFEAVILAGAAFGALFALGKLPQAPGLTLACIAGSIFVSAGLGLIAIGMVPSGVFGHPLFLARMLIVAGFTALAVLAALGADRRAWGLLLRGCVLTVLSAALIGVGYSTRSAWLAGAQSLQIALLVLSLVLATALAGAFCVGLHLVIRAFEVATPRPAR